MTVCSGGLGIISEVKADVEEEAKPSTSEVPVPQGPLMNNGGRDTTNTNDIQKLQQQLQDIKEQVNITIICMQWEKIYILDNANSCHMHLCNIFYDF